MRIALLPLLLTLALVSSYHSSVSQLNAFEGVYVSEEPALVLAMRMQGNSMAAYITDSNTLEPLTCTWQNPTLKLVASQQASAAPSFATLDDAGNLWLTDEQFNAVYFIRNGESLEAVWKELETAYKATTTPAAKQESLQTANTGSYANKKFLHLYTGNGYTEKWAYYLYDNGTFYFRSSSAYTSGGYYDFSAATAGNDGGKYSIEKKSGYEYLTLNWNNGQQSSLRITKTDQGYLLNDEKYFLVGLNEYD